MRNYIAGGLLFFVVMNNTSLATDITVDEDSMQLMKDRQASLSSNISLKNEKAAKDDATVLQEMFNEVEAFYKKKADAADAVDWTRESEGLVATISKCVESKDFDTAAQTSITLAKTCKSCHKMYKKD
jgi:hypothetical protein